MNQPSRGRLYISNTLPKASAEGRGRGRYSKLGPWAVLGARPCEVMVRNAQQGDKFKWTALPPSYEGGQKDLLEIEVDRIYTHDVPGH